MKTVDLLLSIPLLLLSAVGCTSDELRDKPVMNEKGEYAVNFDGNMDMTLTKANTTDLATGVKATICTYEKDATVASATAIVSKGYTVGSTAGTFVGDDSYVMYLPKEDYDFYAVSTNSTTAAPTFTSGVSSVLLNGVDYIWAKTTNQNVGNQDKPVTLAFERKAVKIIINLVSGDGIELTAWKATAGSENDNATITPPDPSTTVTMALADGTIIPSTTLTTAVNMTTEAVNTDAHTATTSYIMLPLASSPTPTPTVTLNVKVKVGGRTAEDKTYTATLSAPAATSSVFQSGKQYSYTATLKANKIEFTGATVANWDEKTGDALTPTEP